MHGTQWICRLADMNGYETECERMHNMMNKRAPWIQQRIKDAWEAHLASRIARRSALAIFLFI